MRFIFTVSILLSALFSCAQTDNDKEGYAMNFKIDGLQDSVIYLGYYFGESTFLSDTARANKKGEFQFVGDKKLPQGVYIIILNQTRLFDITLDAEDQKFTMHTSSDNYIENMTVEGSVGNRIFFEDMRYNMERNREADPFLSIMKDSLSSEQQIKEAEEQLSKINEKVMAHQEKIIEQYPQTMVAKLLKASRGVTPPKDDDEQHIDSTNRYQYLKNHFFDNFDLSDNALLRVSTPMYETIVRNYLDKLVVPTPDSIMQAIKKLTNMAKSNNETYRYLVWNVMSHYSTPKIMGLDEVYVRIYDDYFESGEMDFWVSESLKKNIKEHADKLRLSLIGQKGPNLIMQDQNLTLQSMYDIKNKYILLFFYSPDCGHCKTETPKLVDFYEKNKKRFDLGVFAVCSDTSMQKMKNYIKDMKMPSSWHTVNGPRTTVGSYYKLYDAFSTPTLYILNRERVIIAKKPPIENLGKFLEYHERREALRLKENSP